MTTLNPSMTLSSSFASSNSGMATRGYKTMENLGNMLSTNLNKLFSNDYFRIFIMLVASVYAGYTLQPVPRKLNKMFDTSHFFKYLILFAGSVTALYPLDEKKLAMCVIMPLVVLVVFEMMRRYEKRSSSRKSGRTTSSSKSSGSNYGVSGYMRRFKNMMSGVLCGNGSRKQVGSQ
jgi:hypothetical protein